MTLTEEQKKERRRQYNRKYMQSEKGRESQRKYRQSEKSKEYQRKYQQKYKQKYQGPGKFFIRFLKKIKKMIGNLRGEVK